MDDEEVYREQALETLALEIEESTDQNDHSQSDRRQNNSSRADNQDRRQNNNSQPNSQSDRRQNNNSQPNDQDIDDAITKAMDEEIDWSKNPNA